MKSKIVVIALLFPLLSFGYGRYYGLVTSQNKRPYQEDRAIVLPGLSNGDFFGIYDGHGGDNTSSYLQRNLHRFFAVSVKKDKVDLCILLKKTFLAVESTILQRYDDGSTALATYIDDKNRMYCAWAGDTRAVLEENGKVAFETRDHKPNDSLEQQRITAQGGKIEKYDKNDVWRIGGLAVSRSIGDRAIKQKYPNQVIAEPDCKTVQLTPRNHFLIMASDGLWDVMSSEEAVKLVQEQLRSKPLNFDNSVGANAATCVENKNIEAVAQYLHDEAIRHGSGDNITVCVVYFDWSVGEQQKQSDLSYVTKFWNWLRSSVAH